MYQIIKDGLELSIVASPVWIKKHNNGCFVPCDKKAAQGIVVSNRVYHIRNTPEIEGAETVVINEVDDSIYAGSVVALVCNPADLKNAEQFRRALQMFAASLDDDKAMEIATIYDPWVVGKAYKVGEFITYGVNSVGDPQLYKITQAHTSQADWTPDVSSSLFSAIGLDDSGHPVWSQPTGAHDAYNTGDIVNYNGTLYQSLIYGNTTVPGTDDRYWKVYEEV